MFLHKKSLNSMVTFHTISSFLEGIAPFSLQESYDNAGLIVGDPKQEVKGILVSLDCTEAVIEEAIQKKCNLVLCHHPIVFQGLKKINGNTYVERTVIKAIQHQIGILAVHTNLDNVLNGVNQSIANKLGLLNTKILKPISGKLVHLCVFVPAEHAENLKNGLFEAGAGSIGNYDNCAFETKGRGSYRPLEKSNPFHGEIGKTEYVDEIRLEVIYPQHLSKAVFKALRKYHPYEEIAYQCFELLNENQEIGAGMIGDLPAIMSQNEFLAFLKERMNLEMIRFTNLEGKNIQKVAVCGGAGSFLLKDAIAQGADSFVSADFKYHEFFDAENRLLIADIGHFESEKYTKDLISDLIVKNFPNFAVLLSQTNTNPVNYFY